MTQYNTASETSSDLDLDLVTLATAAKMVGVSRQRIYKLNSEGYFATARTVLVDGVPKAFIDRAEVEGTALSVEKGERLSPKEKRAKRAAVLADNPDAAPHGRYSTYTNWGCRCDECRAAAVGAVTASTKAAAARAKRAESGVDTDTDTDLLAGVGAGITGATAA